MSLGDVDLFSLDWTNILNEVSPSDSIVGTPTISTPYSYLTALNVHTNGTIVYFTLQAGSVAGTYMLSMTVNTSTRGPITRSVYQTVAQR